MPGVSTCSTPRGSRTLPSTAFPLPPPCSSQEMCEAWERAFSLRRSQGAPIPDTARELTGQEEGILLERYHACTWFMESLPPSYDRVDRSTQ